MLIEENITFNILAKLMYGKASSSKIRVTDLSPVSNTKTVTEKKQNSMTLHPFLKSRLKKQRKTKKKYSRKTQFYLNSVFMPVPKR